MEREHDLALLENVVTVAQAVLEHPPKFEAPLEILRELADEVDAARAAGSELVGEEARILVQVLIHVVSERRNPSGAGKASRWQYIARAVLPFLNTDLAKATVADLGKHPA